MFLTDPWEWEADLAADTFEHAQAAWREALEALARDQRPELACGAMLADGGKIGVSDRVAGGPHWTRL